MKICALLLLLLSYPVASPAQNDSLENYQVLSAALQHLDTLIHFDFYYPDAPVDDRLQFSALHPDSFYTLIDPRTYEETTYTGKLLDSMLLASYQLESRLFELRSRLPERIILIGTFDESHLHRRTDDSPFDRELLNLGFELNRLRPHSWNTGKIATKEALLFKPWTDANRQTYKYVICAFVRCSNVIYDKNGDNALIELGYHYKESSGPTGGGLQLLLTRTALGWKVIKHRGLWEE